MLLDDPTDLLDVKRISAISLDLDDTLWPVAPTIERAERSMRHWLQTRAPRTAKLLSHPGHARKLREAVARGHPHLVHDFSALRRETIRSALRQSDEDVALTESAFDVFFAERQRVTLYDDALPALRWLSERYPLVAISNGNADVHRTGVGRWFRTAFNARTFGSGKPHPQIFRAAAASVGLLPRDVLHVGDDPHLDVAGAIGAGMQAAWLMREAPEQHVDLRVRPQLTIPSLRTLCMVLEAG